MSKVTCRIWRQGAWRGDGEYEDVSIVLSGREMGDAMAQLFQVVFDNQTRIEDKLDSLQLSVDELLREK